MKRHRISMGFVAIVFIAMALGCDGLSKVSGHVYDGDENPLVNAKVLFEEVGSDKREHPEYTRRETQTNAEGRFSTGFTHAPFDIKLRLTVTKEGFRPYVTEFLSSDAHKMVEDKHELKIVLEKEFEE